MSSPKVFIEEQLATRANLADQLRLMENHLAQPQQSPSFGTLENSAPTTEEAIARVKAQIADINARIAKMAGGNT
ncbi:MAG: hypothetical protein QOJ94_1603 [Sphingomonadales bacterium]|nr:hypothetical protein [Sphingomonadales bacterium]